MNKEEIDVRDFIEPVPDFEYHQVISGRSYGKSYFASLLEEQEKLLQDKDKEITRLNNIIDRLNEENKKFNKWIETLNKENHRLNNIINKLEKEIRDFYISEYSYTEEEIEERIKKLKEEGNYDKN